jgi:hypothetical protein
MKLFCWDFQPFYIVEDRGFTNLMNVVAPSYKMPSRKYFANSFLPAMFEETCNEWKEILNKEAPSVCMTVDCWTSSKNDSFIALTGHFIDPNFKMQTVLLDCSQFDEEHISQNLAESISKTIDEWGLKGKV